MTVEIPITLIEKRLNPYSLSPRTFCETYLDNNENILLEGREKGLDQSEIKDSLDVIIKILSAEVFDSYNFKLAQKYQNTTTTNNFFQIQERVALSEINAQAKMISTNMIFNLIQTKDIDRLIRLLESANMHCFDPNSTAFMETNYLICEIKLFFKNKTKSVQIYKALDLIRKFLKNSKN